MPAVHKRKLIREAVKTQLIGVAPAYKTAAQDRVSESRIVAWRTKDLPAIAVYSLSETVDDGWQTAPRELKRELQLAVEGAVKAGADVDDALDSLALEIERALHADETFGTNASEAVLQGTEITLFDDGEQLVGVVRLVYGVTYFSGAPEAEDVVLDDFETADIRHDLGGAQHTDNQAHDVVTDLDE